MTGKRVLVVEDNELNLRLFCDLLTAHGYTTDAVRDGFGVVDARQHRADKHREDGDRE